MNNSHEDITDMLANAIEELDKRQIQIKLAVTSFKKQSGATDPCAAYRWFKANEDLLGRESPVVMKAGEELERRCKDGLLRLEADLRDAFALEGWSFSGQWPKYYVEHFLPVVIDENKLGIIAGEDKLSTLDLKKVVASVKAQLNKLTADRDALPAFLQDLHQSYSRLAVTHRPSVSIWDIYRDMVMNRQPRKLWRDATAKTFRPFTELEFRARLTGLLKANMTAISGQQLRLLPPITKDDSMYIYQPVETRFCHVGRIEFLDDSTKGGDLA
jgi:hypothetical protein